MRILLWHVHGSWTTSFVSGVHEYLLPVLPDRGPDGRGRADTWDWPASAREVSLAELVDGDIDVVLLQRPHEAHLLEQHTGLRVGRDVPAVYLEHNSPTGHAVSTRHPVTEQHELTGLPVVHVTAFNAMAWDCGASPTTVIDHGVPDPGHRYTGELDSVAVVVNEPVRRWRITGTDLALGLSESVPVHFYGMGTDRLLPVARDAGYPDLTGRVHELPQDELHRVLARHRAYFHPFRWTSLGLSLLEAMALGMPVLALSTTEAPDAIPPSAGLVTNDLAAIHQAAARWILDPAEARERGRAARAHVLDHYGLDRFLIDWDLTLKEVAR